MMMNDETSKRSIPIFDHSNEWVDGFEAGIVFACLSSGIVIQNQNVRNRNSAQIEMICVELATTYSIKKLDHEFSILNAEPKATPQILIKREVDPD
jgi:hypothetical protein